MEFERERSAEPIKPFEERVASFVHVAESFNMTPLAQSEGGRKRLLEEAATLTEEAGVDELARRRIADAVRLITTAGSSEISGQRAA